MTSSIEDYFNIVQELQRKVIIDQLELLKGVAARMAETVQAGKRLLVFGSGHSGMMAEEAFYRAGGLAAATPLFCTALMLHDNAHLGGLLERRPGLAAMLLDRYHAQSGEMIFIFSNSGVNYLPVEMALIARERGLYVVSISSLAYARQAPLSPLGFRLDEVVDIAIDNCGEPGDALFQPGESAWRVGPTSTIAGALIWNCLVAECACHLLEGSSDLPVFASINMPLAAEHNEKLLTRWRGLNPHL